MEPVRGFRHSSNVKSSGAGAEVVCVRPKGEHGKLRSTTFLDPVQKGSRWKSIRLLLGSCCAEAIIIKWKAMLHYMLLLLLLLLQLLATCLWP